MKSLYIFFLMVFSFFSYGKEKVIIALDWLPNPNHSGLYVAMEKGFFAENHMEVSLAPYGKVRPEQLVASKKADIAFMGAEGLMIVNENGIDITAIAAALSENAQYIAARSDSMIKTPKDFAGRSYAGWTSGWDKALVNQMIINDGGQGEVISPNLGVYGPTALLSKKVDLAWLFDNVETPIAEKQKIDLDKFYLKDYGLANYGTPVLVARSQDLTRNTEIYKNFIKAIEKGYRWAAKNPELTADILIKLSPKGTFADRNLLLEQQKISSAYYTKNGIWGVMLPQQMEELAAFMTINGFAKQKESLKYSNQFFE